ncbi:hypothetical protein HFO60_13930 [Rhizobium leguminosarum]|uniref:hypothetical protein n=1 Tax=Rhizobium leguminosarum TaxID=384 RepID=UPI001C9689FC|nr:hypothetical protein [Rhizobium leguminosarum]MBY5541118.1 hypothetical protein [Rhizobium leguminosarum]
MAGGLLLVPIAPPVAAAGPPQAIFMVDALAQRLAARAARTGTGSFTVEGGDQMSPVMIWQARMMPIATNTAAGMNMLALPLLVPSHLNLGGLKNNENNHKEQLCIPPQNEIPDLFHLAVP